jgi:N-acyl homoserine lactone hydrolase
MKAAATLLPGHRVQRLFVLDFGLFDVGPGQRLIGIPGFLMETATDDGATARILFDTGFPPDYVTDFAATAARDGLARFGAFAEFGAKNTAEGQLAVLGLGARDISHVVLSHGHIDHVGSLPLFAHAKIILTATERADAAPCYFFDQRPIAWPDADYITITGEVPLCEGIALIPTPGHTAGHLSAHVTLPDGRQAILAADAINRISEAEEGFGDAKDPARAMESYHLLMARARESGALMIYGHEPSQWPGLPKAPEAF